MNKTELVASVAEKSGLTKKDTEKAVSAVIESINRQISECEWRLNVIAETKEETEEGGTE